MSYKSIIFSVIRETPLFITESYAAKLTAFSFCMFLIEDGVNEKLKGGTEEVFT